MAETLFRVTVPAKGMLFGEYGVLLGEPAVVVSIPRHCFICDIIVTPRINRETALTVFSDFVDGGVVRVKCSDLAELRLGVSRDLRFFSGICSPWKDLFEKWEVTCHVTRSFSPALGFGSSSALLAALHRVFARLSWGKLGGQQKDVFWERVFDSLFRVQGGGSGYDVAVQAETLWFDDEPASSTDTRVWKYVRTGATPELSPFNVPDLNKFGVFLASHVYSSTARALAANTRSDEHAYAHARIAREFLLKPGFDALPGLMKRSRDVGCAQGILPPVGDAGDFAKVCGVLDSLGVPWKHMGSGGGDCLWIGAGRDTLGGACHPVTGRKMCEEIAFDFSANGGSKP